MVSGYYERLNDFSKLLYGDSKDPEGGSELPASAFLQVFAGMHSANVDVRNG